MRKIMSTAGSVAAVAAVTAGLAMAAPASAAPAARAARPSRPAGSLPVITVAMNGKTIKVGGALQSGGVRITSTVTREPQGDPTLVRLDPGVTVAEFFKGLAQSGGDPNSLGGIAAIVVDATANPGTSSVQADLLPGTYVALDLGGGNPAKAPNTVFTIAKAAHPASLPKPAATVSAIDFGFRGPGRLRDGQLVGFANHGFLVHMIFAVRGQSKAGAREIAKLLLAGKDGQAQKLATGSYGFAGPLSHDASQQLVVGVRPGWWVLACFMNTQDGREHTRLGMERVIQIVR